MTDTSIMRLRTEDGTVFAFFERGQSRRWICHGRQSFYLQEDCGPVGSMWRCLLHRPGRSPLTTSMCPSPELALQYGLRLRTEHHTKLKRGDYSSNGAHTVAVPND